MPISKNNKLMQAMNHRVRVQVQDNRHLVGTFLAFDKHMNLILSDCDEFRVYKIKTGGIPKETKRAMGFVLLRGSDIVTITTVGPPHPNENVPKLPLPGALPGPGMGHPAGRGMPPPAPFGHGQQGMPGLAHGAYPGIGAPHMGMMQPSYR